MKLFEWFKKAWTRPEPLPSEERTADELKSMVVLISQNEFLYAEGTGVCFTRKAMDEIVRSGGWRDVDQKKLQRTLLEGVPYYLRRELWKQLSEIHKLKAQSPKTYAELHGQPKDKWASQIDKDIGRTFSSQEFFQLKGTKEKLRRVLIAYSTYDPEVGYSQGLNYIAGSVLRLMDFVSNESDLDFELLEDETEEDSFWILVNLMQKLGVRQNFLPELPGVFKSLALLRQELRTRLPALYAHLQALNEEWTIAFVHCYLTLTLCDLTTSLASRVMDILLLDGEGVVTGLVMKGLQVCEQALLTMDYEQLTVFVREDFWHWVEEWVQAPLPQEDKKIEVL